VKVCSSVRGGGEGFSGRFCQTSVNQSAVSRVPGVKGETDMARQ